MTDSLTIYEHRGYTVHPSQIELYIYLVLLTLYLQGREGEERWVGSNWAPGFSSELVQRADEEMQREWG